MQARNITKTTKTLGFKQTPSTLISFRYSLVTLIIIFLLMSIIPKILNYGPESINTPFDIQMSKISYNMQFTAIAVALISLIVLANKLLLKDVDRWYKDKKPEKFTDLERLQKIRSRCCLLPYIFFAIETILPTFVALMVLTVTSSHASIMIAKILILVATASILVAVASFIFSKPIYDELLSRTYIEGFNIGIRINLQGRIFILIFPVIFVSILMMALIGYSSGIKEKEEPLFYIYNNYINEIFDSSRYYTLQEIQNTLKANKTIAETDKTFIISEDGNCEVIQGDKISDFVVEYTLQIAQNYNGRIYESYGVDAQGSTVKLRTLTGETYYVGILYEIYAKNALSYLIVTSVFLVAVTLVLIYIFAKSLANNIKTITNGFEKIIDNTDTTSKLPIISNDEIGDLTKSFNAIQDLNTALLQNIKDNQTMLIEKERLASLGQMIGGIAHNLKTPIFSVSGGLEGLNDLINEFDSSIEDPTVNNNDMHDIAKDMREWIQKLKTHVSYMSDVITAVKGQAVTLSENDEIDFTVEELFKHIDILMKHEVKNALIDLKIENNVDNETLIHGNINSLVQIIDNIISNAIEAYNGKPNQAVDLIATIEENNIVIKITDYGPGIPDEVKEKLFNEMITTKGKNGTGLGLFMSYSTIKANFKGNITVESQVNKGTTFAITLPY